MYSRSKTKLIYGVGINDADYPVSKRHLDNGKVVKDWICPYYTIWSHRLEACYSKTYHQKYPSYIGCTLDEKWYRFSTFKSWIQEQKQHDVWLKESNLSRENKTYNFHLDKDILSDTKIYGPETCVLIPNYINSLLLDSKRARGDYPLGVSFNKSLGKFQANINIKGRNKYLGVFSKPEEAHKKWQIEKSNYISHVVEIYSSDLYSDQRVIEKLKKISLGLKLSSASNIETKSFKEF